MDDHDLQRQRTSAWLDHNISPYRNPARVRIDILAALDAHNAAALRPKTDIYTYDDGRTQLLFCLHGTIPIAFRRATYNIPVAVWVTLAYPAEPPLVYVVPTADMLVRQNPHVDLSGRCDLPYMRDWRAKPDVRPLSQTQ